MVKVEVQEHERREARTPEETDIHFIRTTYDNAHYAYFYLKEVDDEVLQLLSVGGSEYNEDERHRRVMVKHCIRELGYNVIQAESGSTMAELQII